MTFCIAAVIQQFGLGSPFRCENLNVSSTSGRLTKLTGRVCSRAALASHRRSCREWGWGQSCPPCLAAAVGTAGGLCPTWVPRSWWRRRWQQPKRVAVPEAAARCWEPCEGGGSSGFGFSTACKQSEENDLLSTFCPNYPPISAIPKSRLTVRVGL